MADKTAFTTLNGLEIDANKKASEGVCLIVDCREPLNPEPCSFCAKHHPKCWLGGSAQQLHGRKKREAP